MTAEEYRNYATKQGKSKPIKQYQGSNKGKAPPKEEVSTSSLKTQLNGYSDTKQYILDKIEQKKKKAEELLEQVTTENEKLEVWAFIRKRLHAIEVIKEDIE